MQERIARLIKNRGGALVAGAVAGLLAVILLIVYLHSYRSSVNSGKQPERVLVATKEIAAGTSGSLIAKQGLYQVTSVQKDQLQPSAIFDPSAIAGRVAAVDIFPGQQLVQGDFTTEGAASIPYQLTGPQRAIAIPIDATHGVGGQVASGDYVDVYVGVSGSTSTSTLVTLLAPNVYVISGSTANAPNVILRVNTNDAAKFAFAADNARLWLVLRPKVGATPTLPITATLASLLAGVKGNG